MITKRVLIVGMATLIVGGSAYVDHVNASHKSWHKIIKRSYSKHSTTTRKSSNGTSLKTNADKAVEPIIGQYGKNVTYSNGSYVINTDNGLNANVTSAPYVSLSSTDSLGRAGVANALLNSTSRQTVTRDKTGNDTKIEPVGFKQSKVGNKYVYNRGHLIGYALAGKIKSFDASESNRKNIVTETAWANQSQSESSKGQLYYETLVRKALDGDKRKSHVNDTIVRYRVTPVYYQNELVPRAIHMEAKSRNGKLNFNVLVPNAMSGVNIDYNTGNVQ